MGWPVLDTDVSRCLLKVFEKALVSWWRHHFLFVALFFLPGMWTWGRSSSSQLPVMRTQWGKCENKSFMLRMVEQKDITCAYSWLQTTGKDSIFGKCLSLQSKKQSPFINCYNTFRPSTRDWLEVHSRHLIAQSNISPVCRITEFTSPYKNQQHYVWGWRNKQRRPPFQKILGMHWKHLRWHLAKANLEAPKIFALQSDKSL